MSAYRLRFHAAVVMLALTAACRSVPPGPTQTSPRDLSPDGLWERVSNDIIGFERSIVKVQPQSFSAFRLNWSALDELLKRAPAEFTAASDEHPVIITLPRPDGTFVRFQIEESPIMEPGLAKRFPGIKTYRGKGLDDATAHVRFERTPLGFHGMVLSASAAFLVDAIGRNDANLYISYFKNSLPPDPDRIVCLAPRMAGKPGGYQKRDRLRQHPSGTPPGVLRVYRIAVAASHRYVDAIHSLHDPNDPAIDLLEEALIAITRTIDRVNLIFEGDVGVRLILVNNEPNIIYTDAGNDPYDDFASDESLLVLNQENLKQRIGPENYDVGHLFIVAPGGVAAEPCACSPFYKAEGLSGNPHPAGNVFDVQYVSHEIGHQFGASHSFNGTTDGCQYRNKDTAYEPGSGSTIMGYSSASGICGNETIQSTADPYFHAISLKEISTFLTKSGPEGGDGCAGKVKTGNRFAPEVSGGPDFILPGGTPFALTVENSSDGDGDALIFSWEEFDLGPPDPPHPEQSGDHLKKRPLFRSWPSSLNTTRFFPALNFIMNPPSVYVAETKPENNRTMVFRVTVRDGRGLYGFDDVEVQVVSKRGAATVGPFEVSQPGVGAVWPRGSTQTVQWSVARTDRPPINCTQVRILLLIRGDENHPILLAQNVPNAAGTTQITLPNDLPLTTTARIKVESVNNIFFNISKADIQIVGP